MKLTVLIENKGPDGLAAEHGLSVLVEHRGRRVLLDTGATAAFADNAPALGVDLEQVDTAALSHGHYDHSGGFEAFFQVNCQAPVYVRKGAEGAYFSGEGERRHYIGVPRGLFERHPERFRFAEGKTDLGDGIWLLPDGVEGTEALGRRAHMSRETAEGTFVPDDFYHEQSLVVEGENGLVMLNSCCHAGVDAIAAGVLRAFPGQKLRAVVGGFHLMGAQGTSSLARSREEVEEICRNLVDLGVEEVYTGHCTGDPGFALLQEFLGDRVRYIRTGDSVEL